MIDNSEQTAGGGNNGERLEVESGYVLVIDQFMLGNKQFVSPVQSLLDGGSSIEDSEDELRKIIEDYGGCLIKLTLGSYRIFRDSDRGLMVLYVRSAEEEIEQEQSLSEQDIEEILEAKEGVLSTGRVFVDTRCLVFVDLALLTNKELFSRYKSLRDSQRDKDARDLLRVHGATIRYGFQRIGDELGVFRIEDPNVVALWPDVVEGFSVADQSA